ncbi:hypothetical protein [Methylobacterium oxalidis]|uniref:Uncharacterized protein n=1 Tax=Methylobacterium oxalidis TaxID=944322 RepID=A0A512J1F7_9HYPH|nr:hypothetical protein [Methylobacterium oxalidis]GEP03689.1 hypothetical protein MOX02_17270 [Methylobacterium oxalidis]GJE33704.1 hypothetical protein LDDCCGHA_3907 [Methylobacterium oxalidis]GLS62274.1 hypothetical protein GCM10007888_06550 [Methylobacterium oxalidis]
MAEATLRALAGRLLKAEIAARRARDVEAVEKAVAPLLRLDAEGAFIAVDAAGNPLAGQGLDDVLAKVQADRPELFEAGGKAAGTTSTTNPFAQGPAYSVTNQMLLWRADPERAEHLAAEAGFKIGRN